MSALSPLPSDPNKIVSSYYRVLYADTDLMGVVNNAHYFRFFEQGRGEYLRHLGRSYASIEESGFRTPLTEAFAHFYKSFRYDDLIRIDCWLSQLKKASFRFEYRLYNDQDSFLMVAGHTVHAILNMDNKVVKIPEWLIAELKGGMAGTGA
jgi:acyl-CoA thioester hydrolase